jgi:hypothetical protein
MAWIWWPAYDSRAVNSSEPQDTTPRFVLRFSAPAVWQLCSASKLSRSFFTFDFSIEPSQPTALTARSAAACSLHAAWRRLDSCVMSCGNIRVERVRMAANHEGGFAASASSDSRESFVNARSAMMQTQVASTTTSR